MENGPIADIFDEIADLIELQGGNAFRVRSYRNAARTVRGLSDRLEDLARRGDDLSELDNIGDSTAEKIHEILERGTCKRLEELREKVPAGVAEMMRLQGLGPRKAMQIHRELNVSTLDELKQAAEDGKVRDLDGFGRKSEQQILKSLATVASTSGRVLLH
jgi:DNA polymerase (family 10)